MGWSCRKEAGEVTDAWTKACIAQTGSQNTFKAGDGRSESGEQHTFFWETSRVEHGDGAITGAIWRFVGEDSCRRCGTFRIEGNGIITRAPKFLREAIKMLRTGELNSAEQLAPRQYT